MSVANSADGDADVACLEAGGQEEGFHSLTYRSVVHKDEHHQIHCVLVENNKTQSQAAFP